MLTASALLAAGIALSCGGKDDGNGASQGAGAAGGSSVSSGGGTGGAPGASSANTGGDGFIDPGTGGAGGSCQQHEIPFTPQTPTVMIVVDRSGSMYDSGFWQPLQTAVLNVVQSLQDKVNFGFLTFTGVAPDQCPLLAGTDGFALGNYEAIAAAYEAASVKPPGKLETPTGSTFMNEVIPALLEFPEPGPKYILFVTDGEPDRCDDGPAVCARDDVVAAVQSAYAQGIGTWVFGLGEGSFAEHLQDVANAGAGQPVREPRDGTQNSCYLGAGTYAATGGTATFYTPEATNAAALEAELNAAISGAQSCTFDLQGEIEVDLDDPLLGEPGQVKIDGQDVAYGMESGWYMASPTQLVLVGAACEQLKSATQGIEFNFPCELTIAR
ncbi:hypothetical protein SOCE26_036430 [Sorangium cellulosum]|uniref:VWFA domain-containing protein n=1 Tax=Sorangium cellulosum TaxID=56 RepID=A0A2L0ESE2_SORCE|nr:hypothetical protein SOCE26_036430 [Sorangium cellulosum]